MAPIRPDPMGGLDILAAAMMYFTVSPVPEIFALTHAGFLFFKGTGSIIEPIHLPMPVFILGAGADLISAAIIITGTPPVLAEFKIWIAGLLFLKGLWSLLGFMGGMN